jgi:hypothetical protein
MTEDGSILHICSILQIIQKERRLTYSLVYDRYLFAWLVTLSEATDSLLKARGFVVYPAEITRLFLLTISA